MVTLAGLSCVFLDRDSLYLFERNLVLSAVIKLSCPRRFVVRDLLRPSNLPLFFR